MSDFCKSKVVKAGKIHICCECKSVIVLRQMHYHFFVVTDGACATLRMCNQCHLACNHLFELVPDCELEFGRLYEVLEEVVNDTKDRGAWVYFMQMTDRLNRLTY